MINEKRITVSLPREIYDILEEMCYEDVGGLKIRRRSLSDVVRELIIRGLKSE